MTSSVLRSVLEKEAKKIQESLGLKWTKALDEASKKFGFHNYKHYQKSQPQKQFKTRILSTPSFRRKTPAHPLQISGGARQLMQEFLELLDKPDTVAYSSLRNIALHDADPFRKYDAAFMLFRNFEISFTETFAILKLLPPQSLPMIWPHLELEEVIRTKLLHFYMNDGQMQFDHFATHPYVDELSLNDDIDYRLDNNKITAMGSFNLSLELQYGSNSDLSSGNGDLKHKRVTGKFTVEINSEKELNIRSADLKTAFY